MRRLERLIGVAGIAALLWWWLQTIESAMVGSAAGPGDRRTASPDAPVRTLVPRILRSLPSGRFAALMSRELRYWLRDPRRRASLISLLAASVVVPFAFTFGTKTQSPGALVYSLIFAGAFGLVAGSKASPRRHWR